jgi:integrase
MRKAQVANAKKRPNERARRTKVDRNIYRLTDIGKNVFEVRAYIGRDANGHPCHTYDYVKGTLKDAQRARTELEHGRDLGLHPVPEVEVVEGNVRQVWNALTTVNDAVLGWKQNGWDDLSPSTKRRYQSIFAVHIRDTIGRQRIAKLGPYEVETYFRDLKKLGLSESSVRQTRAMLHRACTLARRWSKKTLPNPIQGTELPTWAFHEMANEVRSPTVEEVRKILTAVPQDNVRLAAFLRLVAATGMRRGEACGVRWNDLDLDKKNARIDESVVTDVGGAKARGPKSRASVRKLAIDEGTANVLRRLRAATDEGAKAGGFDVRPTHFVFASELPGTEPPHPDSISHAFAEIRTKADVAEDVHLHSFRHWQSTAVDAVLSPTQKQKRMGWSNSAAAKMSSVYTDPDANQDALAANHVGSLLDGTPTKRQTKLKS